jgi:hypothetical protein
MSLYGAHFAPSSLDPYGYRTWTFGPQSWVNAIFDHLARGTFTPGANKPGFQFDTKSALDTLRAMISAAVTALGYNVKVSMQEEIVNCEYPGGTGATGNTVIECSCCKFGNGAPNVFWGGSNTFGATGQVLAGGTAKVKFDKPGLADYRILRRCNTSAPVGADGSPGVRTKANCLPDVMVAVITQPISVEFAFKGVVLGNEVEYTYENTFAFEFGVGAICGVGGVEAPDPEKMFPPDHPGHEHQDPVPGQPFPKPSAELVYPRPGTP